MRTWAGAVWLLLAALGSAAEEPIDGWLPEETLFCLSFESPRRTAARLDGGRYAEVRGDPPAQRLAIEVKGLVAEAREASLERGDVWLGPFWDLARGPLLLAVVRARGGEAPLVVMDAEMGAFGRHLERLADAGVLGPGIERDGIHMRPGAEGVGAVFWVEREGVVAFSWRRDAVETVPLQRGRGPPLAAVRRKLRADADALLYVPRAALREIEDQSTDLASLDLPDDVWLGLTVALDEDALDVRAFLFAPRPRRGVLALLDGPNGELDAPAFLPAGTPFVAARLDLPRILRAAGARGDETRLVRPFVRALGHRFALAEIGEEQVLLAEVEREAWMKKLLSAFPGEGGVHEAPDGAVGMRDGWLVAGPRARTVMRLLSDPAPPPRAVGSLPRERIAVWRLPPRPPRFFDDPMRLLGEQAGALVNDPEGLLLVHRVALR